MSRRRAVFWLLLPGLATWLGQSLVSGRPGVELGQVSSSGALPAPMARQTIAAALPRFEACWNRTSRRYGGALVLHLRVSASPVRHRRISPGVTVQRRSVFEQGLESCVLGVAGSLLFTPAQRDSHIWAQLILRGGARASPRAPSERRASLEVSGRVVNATNGQPLAGATVLILQPWVTIEQLDPDRLTSQVVGMAVSSPSGRFRVRVALPRGFAYGVVVLAWGFETAGSESVVKPARAGLSSASLGAIRLVRRRY